MWHVLVFLSLVEEILWKEETNWVWFWRADDYAQTLILIVVFCFAYSLFCCFCVFYQSFVVLGCIFGSLKWLIWSLFLLRRVRFARFVRLFWWILSKVLILCSTLTVDWCRCLVLSCGFIKRSVLFWGFVCFSWWDVGQWHFMRFGEFMWEYLIRFSFW